MAIELVLHTNDAGQLTVTHDGEPLAGPTALDALPSLPALQGDPYGEGRALTEALGGDALLERLAADPDLCLLLLADDASPGGDASPRGEGAHTIPWEFAAIDGRQLLACQYAMVRLVDRPALPAPEPDTLQFLVLGADPLVGPDGEARDRYRLQIDRELRAIRRELVESGVALVA